MTPRTGTTTKPNQPVKAWRLGATALLLLGSVLLVGPTVTGCKGFIEDQREYWQDWSAKPDPWQVVKTTTSPDRKARYIALLREPSQNGGSQAQQDEMVLFLVGVAEHDPAPICRLQAIHKLGEFKDPRRIQGLQTAFDQASKFTEETISSQLRQQALRALAETRDPAAQGELIRVASAGAKQNDPYEQQMTLDERLTAVRGLANFRGPEVNNALIQILRTEKDIALRDRARQSLETITGRQLPDDAQAWEQALNTGPGAAPAPAPKWNGPLHLLSGTQK